jgi:hypothetical protein
VVLELNAGGKVECLPLCAAPDVIAVPGYTSWYVGIDTTNSQEGTSILYTGIFGYKKHGETGHCEQAVADHEDPSLLEAISEKAPLEREV